jgi:hypothetical protein
MTDSEAGTRAILNFFATGDLDVSSAVADEYVDHQGLGDIEIRGPNAPDPSACRDLDKGRHAGGRGPFSAKLGRRALARE